MTTSLFVYFFGIGYGTGEKESVVTLSHGLSPSAAGIIVAFGAHW